MTSNIKRNYIYNVIYQVFAIILPIIATPYISRKLGPEKIGMYSFNMSIAQYFVMFAMLGINNYGNRTCAAVRDDRGKLSETFWEIYFCQMSMSIICIIIYLTTVFFRSNEEKTIGLIFTIYVCAALLDINWFFCGVEEFKVITIRNVVAKVITVVLIFILVKREEDLWKYTLVMCLGTLIGVAAFWPLLHKWIDIKKVNIKKVFTHVKPILILFAPVIAVSLYRYMDKIMLGALSSMTETGYYENAEKLINIPLGFINALGIVMLPRMSSLVARNETETAENLIDNSMLFVCFLSCAMTFGVSAISDDIVDVLMGNNFEKCAVLISILAPTMVFFSFANVIRTQYLIPRKKDRSYLISVFLGAAVNLIANYTLIPILESIGAAIGTVIAEFTVCFVQSFSVRKELNIKKYIIWGYPFLLTGIFMYYLVRLSSMLLENTILSIGIQIIIGIFFYCLLSANYIKHINSKIYTSVANFIKNMLHIKKTSKK